MTAAANPTSSARNPSAAISPEALAALAQGRPASLLANASVWDILLQHEQGGLKGTLQAALNALMLLERELFLNAASHERTDARAAYANGFRDRSLNTGLGTLALAVPQTRALPGTDTAPYYPSCLEQGMRSQQALILAVAEMYFTGVSTRKVEAVAKQLGITGLSCATVSRYAAKLDEKLAAWRQKHLGQTLVVILDARYENVRVDGVVRDCAVLSAIGVTPDGRRTVLGVSVSLSEAEIHWREFLESLVKRGLCGIRLIISDAHEGLRAARRKVFGSVPWQRCQFHLAQNAQHHCSSQAQREAVAVDLRRVFDAETHAEATTLLVTFATKYAKVNPKLAAWAQEDVPEGLTVMTLGLGKASQKSLRTSNLIERTVQQELKRRTVAVRVFPNDASLLRLVTARLAELDDEWRGSKKRPFAAAVAAFLGKEVPAEPDGTR